MSTDPSDVPVLRLERRTGSPCRLLIIGGAAARRAPRRKEPPANVEVFLPRRAAIRVRRYSDVSAVVLTGYSCNRLQVVRNRALNAHSRRTGSSWSTLSLVRLQKSGQGASKPEKRQAPWTERTGLSQVQAICHVEVRR